MDSIDCQDMLPDEVRKPFDSSFLKLAILQNGAISSAYVPQRTDRYPKSNQIINYRSGQLFLIVNHRRNSMYKIAISALIAVCASINVSAQGTSSEAKGTVPSPQDPKPLSAEPVPGSEDHKVKEKLTNSAFVEKSAAMVMSGLTASRMALRTSTTKATRDFAITLVKSLDITNKQLRFAASPSGTAVPKTLDRTQNEAVSKLTTLSGADFDKSYAELMKQNLGAMVALFENAASEQSLNAELRDFAKRTLDTLRNHQLLAHNLAPD